MPTFALKPLRLREPSSSFLSYAKRRLPEGNGETFPAGSPVLINAAGFVTEGASPVTEVLGIALSPGQDTANDGDVRTDVVILTDDVQIYANLREGGAAPVDHTYAATDLGALVEIRKEVGGLPDGGDFWYFDTTVTAAAALLIDDSVDYPPHNEYANTFAAVGDINARVQGIVLNSARSYDA